jgi:hypothetical protein
MKTVEAGVVDGGEDLVDLEDVPLPLAEVGCPDVPAQRFEMFGEQRPALGLVEQQRLAALVLVDREQVRAGGQQLRPQAEEVGKNMEDVGRAHSSRARQHRRQFLALHVPEQVVDDDVVARTGRGDVYQGHARSSSAIPARLRCRSSDSRRPRRQNRIWSSFYPL